MSDKDEFKEVARKLCEAFLADLESDKGYIYYDKHVQYRIQDYIDDYYRSNEDESKEDNASVTTDYTDY